MSEADIAQLISAHGLWLLFVLTVIEGPVVTLIGAAMAGRGLLDPVAVFGVALAGDLAGDAVLYAIGRLSPRLTQRLGGPRADAARARISGLGAMMQAHGWQVIALGKLTHVAGFAVILAAGAARLPFRLFLLVSAAATLPKVGALMLAGWIAGQAIALPWLAGLGALLVFLAGIWLLRTRAAT